jgi:hypothetical protein
LEEIGLGRKNKADNKLFGASKMNLALEERMQRAK